MSFKSLVLALAIATATTVAVQDAQAQQPPQQPQQPAQPVETAKQECADPAKLQQFEVQVQALEAQNAQWATKLDTATGAWNQEKSQLESQFNKERADHRATSILLQNTRKESQERIAAFEKKVENADQAHQAQLKQLQSKVEALEQKVAQLTQELHAEQAIVVKRDTEVSEAQAKLIKFADQIKSLEKDVQLSRKKNEALRLELDHMDEKLTFAGLLSSYYDEGVVIAGHVAETVRARFLEAQAQTSGYQQHLDTLKQTAHKLCEVTDKLYAEHLAATVDPLLAQLQKAAEPHVIKYKPVVEQQLHRFKTLAIRKSQVMLQRAKEARILAIRSLEQHEAAAPHAQKIVDFGLYALAFPFVFLLVRTVLRLVFWIVRTILYIVCCGCCCGRCTKRRPSAKLKSRSSRKSMAAAAAAASAAANKKPSPSSASSGNVRRSSGSKKHKK